ncbi:DUF6345 domain-containing protein [Massilia sp. SYSU DXS3249]
MALMGMEDPIMAETQRAEMPRGGAHVHGEFSIEKFCEAGALTYTHEDAQGFWEYLNKFHPTNFWYRDDGVRAWAYYEEFDNWQDTYGMDAALAVYHSGHGGMDANGVFYVPMGANWGGLGCTATSANMRIGNEYARYIFWSTCESLRVLSGHSPIRTWGNQPSPGFRMMFGFETVSWDNPNYGKNFWKYWNNGKESLGTAWLKGSWDIAHDQAPSVVACGATAEEAKNRVFNENKLEWGAVSHAYWWWRWYNVARSARAASRRIPREAQLALLRPAAASLVEPGQLADRFGFAGKGLAAQQDGSFLAHSGERLIARDERGAVDVRFALPNLDNESALPLARARNLAEDAIRQFDLDPGNSLVFDRVLLSQSAGASLAGDGRIEPGHTSETIFQYRQVISGIPVITPDAGIVRVGVGNDGSITTLHSSLREVEGLSSQARTVPPQPPEAGRGDGPDIPRLVAGASDDDVDALLASAVGTRLRALVAGGANINGVENVPGTTEVGYHFHNGSGELVARKGIEVDFGGGYRKRYWVQQTIFG